MVALVMKSLRLRKQLHDSESEPTGPELGHFGCPVYSIGCMGSMANVVFIVFIIYKTLKVITKNMRFYLIFRKISNLVDKDKLDSSARLQP